MRTAGWPWAWWGLAGLQVSSRSGTQAGAAAPIWSLLGSLARAEAWGGHSRIMTLTASAWRWPTSWPLRLLARVSLLAKPKVSVFGTYSMPTGKWGEARTRMNHYEQWTYHTRGVACGCFSQVQPPHYPPHKQDPAVPRTLGIIKFWMRGEFATSAEKQVLRDEWNFLEEERKGRTSLMLRVPANDNLNLLPDN